MIQIDGKPVDLTKPETWGNNIQIQINGFIKQTKDGVTTHIEHKPTVTTQVTALQSKG